MSASLLRGPEDRAPAAHAPASTALAGSAVRRAHRHILGLATAKLGRRLAWRRRSMPARAPLQPDTPPPGQRGRRSRATAAAGRARTDAALERRQRDLLYSAAQHPETYGEEHDLIHGEADAAWMMHSLSVLPYEFPAAHQANRPPTEPHPPPAGADGLWSEWGRHEVRIHCCADPPQLLHGSSAGHASLPSSTPSRRVSTASSVRRVGGSWRGSERSSMDAFCCDFPLPPARVGASSTWAWASLPLSTERLQQPTQPANAPILHPEGGDYSTSPSFSSSSSGEGHIYSPSWSKVGWSDLPPSYEDALTSEPHARPSVHPGRAA